MTKGFFLCNHASLNGLQSFCGGCLIFCFEWHLWIFHAYSLNLPRCHLLIHHWCNAPDYETDAIECTGSVIARLWGIIIVGYMVCHRGRRLILAPGLNASIFCIQTMFLAVCSYLFTQRWQSIHTYSTKPHKPLAKWSQHKIFMLSPLESLMCLKIVQLLCFSLLPEAFEM